MTSDKKMNGGRSHIKSRTVRSINGEIEFELGWPENGEPYVRINKINIEPDVFVRAETAFALSLALAAQLDDRDLEMDDLK